MNGGPIAAARPPVDTGKSRWPPSAEAGEDTAAPGLGWPAGAARFLRTVRHLRGRQLVHQALHRLPLGSSAAPLRPLHRGGPGRPALRGPSTDGLPPPAAVSQSGLRQGILTFQNRPAEVGFPPDWNRDDLPLHWLYHLHYQDWLWDLQFDPARAVAMDWMASHPPGPDRAGWDPYPTSLRLTNWCALFLGRHRAATLADPAFRDALWASVQRQAAHLARNLEWRLLGNHLLENAAALALAGSCFDHAEANRWFETGRRLLTRELREQMLADGGHVERSPMYQCRVLWVLLLLRGAGRPELRKLARPCVALAAAALAALTHPDGGIALLNDSALGVHPAPEALVRAAGPEAECGSEDPRTRQSGSEDPRTRQSGSEDPRTRQSGSEDPRTRRAADGPFALAETGYYGARTAAGDYVVCDAGPLGPDYQPGHGHADLFSFELSLRGARVVVDSGVSSYEEGAARDWCRSTRAHNTVEIGGADSAEVWGAFRVGRRCRPRGVRWTANARGFELSGRHDGYRHLPGRPEHERTFRWRSTGARAFRPDAAGGGRETASRGGSRLDIVDRVTASRPVRSVARLHFHPDCRLGDPRGGTCAVSFPGGHVRVSWSGWEAVSEEPSRYCPEFGLERPNPCLAFSADAAAVRGTIRIEAV